MTKYRVLVAPSLSLLLALSLLVACGKKTEQPQPPPQQQPEATGQEVEKKAQEAFEAAKSYTLEQKEEYQKIADAKLQEFDVKIKELKTKAEKAGAEAKVKLNKQIEELQKKQDAARKKLSELKTAGEEAWEALKREMDATLTDIEDFIKNLIPAGE